MQLHTTVELDLDFAGNRKPQNGWEMGNDIPIKIISFFKEGMGSSLYLPWAEGKNKPL